MSRPPIRRQANSPRRLDNAGRERYFSSSFAELLNAIDQLAKDDAIGIEIPDGGLARLLLETPALLAHILGEHQNHYAEEAFFPTAKRSDNLLRHAARLAHSPDHGVAAEGVAVFTAKDGLSGEIPAGFALLSEPSGESKAQTYETLSPVYVDAHWNRLRPIDRTTPIAIEFSSDRLTLALVSAHGLDAGEIVLFEGRGRQAICAVDDVLDDHRLTLRRLSDSSDDRWPSPAGPDDYRLWRRPNTQIRAFGWDADATVFSHSRMRRPRLFVAPTGSGESSGYQIDAPPTVTFAPGVQALLSEPARFSPDSWVGYVHANGGEALKAVDAFEAQISFIREARIPVPQPSPAPEGFPLFQSTTQRHARRGAVVTLQKPNGDPRPFQSFRLDAVFYAGWEDAIGINWRTPQTAPAVSPVEIDADLSEMAPGRTVVLTGGAETDAATATVTRLTAPATLGAPWRVFLSIEDGRALGAFTKDELIIHGNAVRVTHGESRASILGGSDGKTGFQRFRLREAPITRRRSPDGAKPDIALRVDGVAWRLVEDFHDAGAQAPIAQAVTHADQTVDIVFGGDGRGAAPPAGRRNITADVRIGLGAVGNAASGRITRIKRASPLLDAVNNFTPIIGGADPAATDSIREQATGAVQTFDRAVSVQDYAALAQQYPGIARAAARWLGNGGVELVVADIDGETPANLSALRSFLDLRRDTSVRLRILTPQAVDVHVAIIVERDRRYLADVVRRTISNALLGSGENEPGLFTFRSRRLSDPQSLSGLYEHLLRQDGVVGVRATRFAIRPEAGVADILHATERQWLRLSPGDLEMTITVSEAAGEHGDVA